MDKVDIIIVGAEGVVESGGIVNKVSLGINCLTQWKTIYFGVM